MANLYLSKSDFLKYQICPSYLWLWKHKREVVPVDEEEDIKRRLEQGNEVERHARQLFNDAVLVKTTFNIFFLVNRNYLSFVFPKP
jgi:hypothetical protein